MFCFVSFLSLARFGVLESTDRKLVSAPWKSRASRSRSEEIDRLNADFSCLFSCSLRRFIGFFFGQILVRFGSKAGKLGFCGGVLWEEQRRCVFGVSVLIVVRSLGFFSVMLQLKMKFLERRATGESHSCSSL